MGRFPRRAPGGVGLTAGARHFVEDQLLTADGFRTTVALADALRDAAVDDLVVETLIGRRLIRPEVRLGHVHLELTHDVLAPVVAATGSALSLVPTLISGPACSSLRAPPWRASLRFLDVWTPQARVRAATGALLARNRRFCERSETDQASKTVPH